MWSKLKKKVVKPERKDVDVDNPDGKVILQKFDRIPSYVGDVSEPIDWHLPPSCGSPIPNGHGMRPLSTFAASYSPKLPCRRSLSSFENEESRHNIELDLEGSPDSDDNLFFNNDQMLKETNGDHISNGNDRSQSQCNHNSFSDMPTPTLPKKDKKYERVVTNNQVVKEHRNSPARRKKTDLPPVSIPDKKERRVLINGDSNRELSSTTSEHRLSSGPSTATSDNVFDLEVHFERQESGYATLDDQASSGDKSSNIGDRCDLFTPSPEAVSAPTTPGMRDLFFNSPDVTGDVKPSSDPFRIYPTFRKQVNSGNNNTEVVSASVAAAKPTNLDINQNLNQSGRINIETTVEIHPQPLGDDKGEYYPADSSISRIYRKDRRKADDQDLSSSVEDIYASVPKGIQRLSADEGNGTASSESSRSSKIEDEESIAESESTVKTNETSGTLLASDEDDVGDDDVIGDDLDDGIDLDLDIDSEDNDVAPPIPEKNYRLLNEGTIMRETVGKRSSGKGSGSESDVNPSEDVIEPTHMSWDEVMTEARSLGIPWSKPESVKTDSDRFTDTDTCDGLSSVASSEVLSSRSEPPPAAHNRRLQLTTETKHEKKRSPFKDKFKFQSLFSKKSKDRHSSDSSLHKYTTMGSSSASSSSKKRSSTPTHAIAPSSLGSPVSNPGCVCSPRSSRMKVPRSPAHHHSSITLPRDISGSTASWGSTNSCFQTRSLSVSHQSTTSLSSAQSLSSSAYGPQNMMSVSMMASIPSHNIQASAIYMAHL
ncbi:hypothetical protein CAPTEDRAFT_212205 [Capitella teleta]|uniref:Uncharacterized protein n=1 Tax=Capitella teleta TaxID=283909 RepID=R7T962_CAPTE|nr:hypothetical protein CAPTEDRAFT_212205 [Capitella teleta]|eukprot:ELT87940.1 hypothetical protein CAPTEDRAFT_212205 [Capitella teleta]